jgi:phosphoglycolate phosphatase-like HAD superfamily hydrolase
MSNGAVILDVDGTLVDSNDAHARAWVEAFAENGIAVPFERVRRAIGMGGDKLMPAVAGIAEDGDPGERISRRRGEIFREKYLPGLRPFFRVRDLVERFLADDLTVAVASSAKKDELEPLLEIAGIADLIDAQTSSDDAERSKPDPDIVKAALERSGADRARAVMIGDTPYDLEAAARAGIEFVGVECGGWNREALRGAVEVYGSPAELLKRYERSVVARLKSLIARTS